VEAPPLSRRSRAGGAAARVKTGGLGTERGVAEFFPQCITPSSVNWGENTTGGNMHPPPTELCVSKLSREDVTKSEQTVSNLTTTSRGLIIPLIPPARYARRFVPNISVKRRLFD